MNFLRILFLVLGFLSLLMSLYSRFTMQLIPLAPGGLDASAFLMFANTCFLLTIVLIMSEKKK